MTYVMLILGFVLLIKGADFFVEGSSAVARKLHIPSMVIGMTIVAMGTSLPECAVSVTASIAGNNELCQTFHNRRLSDAWFPDQARIILRPAA